MTATVTTDATLLDAVVRQVRACDAVSDGVERPHAILWTDPEQQWSSLRSTLCRQLPELLVLGEFAPEDRTGPAIWIRCLIDRALDDPKIPEDRVPIIYLPGVGRQQLRAGDDCPTGLQPLVDLLYRGTLWLQKGGRDWTVTAFMTSQQGLNLNLARDQATVDALMRSLPELAETPLAQLHGKRLEAEDFDKLLAPDVVRDLLRWMGDPTATRERMGTGLWAAFRSQCSTQFNFDPDADGETTAGEKLGRGDGSWTEVWSRFEEVPQAYSGIPDLLRRSKPAVLSPGFLEGDPRSRWPDVNDAEEEAVRATLAGLKGRQHTEACKAVAELEKKHGKRRSWIWARLGMSPMALALEPLAKLGDIAKTTIGGSTPEEIAQTYVAGAWEADAASWHALAEVPTNEEALVREVVQVLLEPWLDDSARHFQSAVESHPLPAHAEQQHVTVSPGTCLLFVDGLRFDLGQALVSRLEGRGCRVDAGRRWAALPTVTATGKPAVCAVANMIIGTALGEDFAPVFEEDGRPVDARSLRAELEVAGYTPVDAQLGGWPKGEEARGWIESGQIDDLGHKLGSDLAQQIDHELDRLAEQVNGLLVAGWSAVRIVTDHGWLLLPGGLPRVDLPKHLTASRWSRCAVVAGQSQVSVPTVPWHWNAAEHFATAPGIACFNKSRRYAHGGLSIQECLIPDLLVERPGEAGPRATVRSITWRGMRCFVEAELSGSGVTADLRLERPVGPSVAASPKPLDEDGSISLVVVDDAHEKANLVLVLLGPDDTVLAQRKTKVGDSS